MRCAGGGAAAGPHAASATPSNSASTTPCDRRAAARRPACAAHAVNTLAGRQGSIQITYDILDVLKPNRQPYQTGHNACNGALLVVLVHVYHRGGVSDQGLDPAQTDPECAHLRPADHPVGGGVAALEDEGAHTSVPADHL